ncbi:MAG: DUF885 family protein [Gemmatimonadaceae bacterium]
METRLTLATLVAIVACAPGAAPSRTARYDDLTSLFTEWREFQKPPLVDGVADYAASAMATQHRELADFQQRLSAIDTTGWSIPQQVDYHLVRAEMNGLDFDHRVLRPWERDPAFYVSIFPSQSDVPAREGPHALGAIELWTYEFPLSADRAAELRAKVQTVPNLLARARQQLTGNARDLWIAGTQAMREQSADLGAVEGRAATSPDLLEGVRRARVATDSLVAWLDAQSASKTGPSGVGIEEYDWFLANVHLVPFTWQDQVAIMRRELARSLASLRLEEQRNRKLPALTPVASEEEHSRRLNAAVSEYMKFLGEHEVVSIREYMDAALRARIGRFNTAPISAREFFTHVDYREPVAMRTHGYHWFDLARMANEPHASPIRRVPLLYNIFDERAEGLATGMEEMMMHVGLFDGRPRARELIWVLLAQRAARALGDLRMHANEISMDSAVTFASQWTPRGWLRQDGNTVRGEQHLYLQQPSYGTSYVIGKVQIEQLIGERSRQLDDAFTLKGFMDDLNAAGMIPVTLIRWELTGDASEIRRLAPPQP